MKRILPAIALFIFGTAIFLSAQKQISLDDLFKKSTFRPEYSGGFTSMKDGEHYIGDTLLGNDHVYMKCEYKTGKQVGIIFKESELIPEGQTKAVAMEDMIMSP